MKRIMISASLLVATCFLAFALSSFYIKPSQNQPDELTQQGFKSVNKKSISKDALTLNAAFQNDYFTETLGEGYYFVEVKADEYKNETIQRPPLNLSIVIDRSGSMSGEKIKQAKEAAKFAIDQLSSQDYISVVMYDNDVQVVYPASSVQNKSLIKNKIDEIVDRGGTNLTGGMQEGFVQVKKYFKPNYINRVLLMSDGLANEGITEPSAIQNIVLNHIRKEGISISTFGVGRDYNEDLMTAIAEKGSGNYYFIDEASAIAGIFQKELNGIMNNVAQNAILKIKIPSNVSIEQVYGYDYSEENDELIIPLHHIFSEETKAILIRYNIPPNSNQKEINFYSHLYFDYTADKRKSELQVANVQYKTDNMEKYSSYYNEWVEAQVVLQNSNDKLEAAMKEIDNGNYEKGKALVKENNDFISSKATLVSKSVELQKVQTTNAVYEEKIKEVEVMSVSDKKYLQKGTKSENYKIRSKKK